ncbi:MAG TPA: leucine--tRNA ligase [Thermoleophilia bacterium]|nr:leucine--tRNA ligase [Thermoleophilia bacterium]
MDERYKPQEIEQRWQRIWREREAYRTPDTSDRPKFYCLDFFPYPSGDGLSVGHLRNYVPTDMVSRLRRMRGYNVMHPMGWDAFGLPAENYAIKMGVSPSVTTTRNIANYHRQMDLIGLSFDWSREITSCLPDYYRWTQWFFLLMYERGLAYRGTGQQWWCPVDKTILANEQVHDGRCWRCGSEVTKVDLEQWHFRITDYAQALLDDLETIDWPEPIKLQQANWIGRSEGAEVEFALPGRDDTLTVFTTRPDTLYGATYMVLAPEHPLVAELTTAAQRAAVTAYQDQARRESEIERLSTEKEKTGVFTGAYAVNPVNGEQIPIWISDYVLMGYGTGAIMAVPAHDERDFAFATAFGLPIVEVIAPPSGAQGTLSEAYTGDGVMVNSAEFDGLAAPGEAFAAIVARLAERGLARPKVNFKLRDWLISRQRYWGVPIPIVYCDGCGIVPVPAEQLPVLLPELDDYKPTDDGQSPLARDPEFVATTCPRCGGPARRETDTMDTFVCSSWYHFRYPSPHDDTAAFDRALVASWLPVDLYVGGAEHAVMHLLYARFFCKVLRDAGYVDFGEPYARLRNQGLILAEDGAKMSKSKGNVVTPDSVVERYGADALRLYELFIAPFEQSVAWNDRGVQGCLRFLTRFWGFALGVAALEGAAASGDTRGSEQAARGAADAAASGGDGDGHGAAPAGSRDLARTLHKTVRKVTGDLDEFRFNTAVAALMEGQNEILDVWSDRRDELDAGQWRAIAETFVLLLAPMTPHIAEELWQRLGHQGSVLDASWPAWDEALAADEVVTVIVQVNGKLRDRLEVPVEAARDDVLSLARAAHNTGRFLEGKQVVKEVYVPGKLVNFVVR